MNKCDGDENTLQVLLWEKKEGVDVPSLAGIPFVSKDQLSVVKVPRYPAETKSLFLQGRALWPITYHPMTPPPELTAEEKERFTSAMRRAIELGKEAASRGNAPIGMVILDENGSVIGECGDNRGEMFLDHCCYACVRQQSALLKQRMSGKRAKKTDPYLCTNCDVVITREPCVMYRFLCLLNDRCCMCLLHSRVRRVFYGCDDRNGGLKSHVHLHYVPQLNHHFRVFRGVLEEECRQLWEERGDKESLYFV